MNYQQTKTIQKYSINKNLLVVGLLVFASFVQGCGVGKKSGAGTGTGDKSTINTQALLAMLGNFGEMTPASLKTKVGEDAKDRSGKPKKVQLASKDIETLKLAEKVEMVDEQTSKTKSVSYFEALGSKLVQGKGMLKGEEVVANEAINGLFKKVLDEFSKEDKNKNAKVFVLVRLLELQEKVQSVTSKDEVQQAVEKFKCEIAKVKHDAYGVLVNVDLEGKLEFVNLTEADKGKIGKKIKKYILSEKLYEFIEEQVIKPIEEDVMKIN